MLQINQLAIEEVSQRTGIPIRTIRYYIVEGLLPPPVSKGRNAWYEEMHVERLNLIQRLKKEFMPLGEIRNRLNNLNDEQIRDANRNYELSQTNSKLPYPNRSSEELFQEKMALTPSSEPDSVSAYINEIMDANTPDLDFNQAFLITQNLRPAPQMDEWKKVILAEGIELHLDSKSYQRNRKAVEILVELARLIFNNR